MSAVLSPRRPSRLRRIKAAVDPDNLIRSNHPVPPAKNAER
jgi:Berberine and berberine like